MKGHALFQCQLITIQLTILPQFKMFFCFRTTSQISSVLAQSNCWWKGFNVVNIKDNTLFQGENEWRNVFFEIFFCRTTRLIFTKLDRKHPWLSGCWSRLHYKIIEVSSFFNCQLMKFCILFDKVYLQHVLTRCFHQTHILARNTERTITVKNGSHSFTSFSPNLKCKKTTLY